MGAVDRAIRATERFSPYVRSRLAWQRAVRRGDIEHRVLSTYVAKGTTAVDIGASRGHHTAAMMHLVGRAGRVHAFEPNPSNASRLARLARSGPRNLEVHAVALSDHEGRAELNVPAMGGRALDGLGTLRGPVAGAEASAVVEVRTATLDEVLAGERPAFVKCDVEGHELAVLQGAEQTLLAERPALVIEIEQRHHPSDPMQEVLDWFLERDFGIWPLFAQGCGPLEDFDVERHQLAFVTDGFQNSMPAGYVNNFLVLPGGAEPPESLRAR